MIGWQHFILTALLDFSDDGRTIPEEYEEGIGLLNNTPNLARLNMSEAAAANTFAPDYSFSSLSGRNNANESTEMLEQAVTSNKQEIYQVEAVPTTADFRRSNIKEKSSKRSSNFSWKSIFQRRKKYDDGQPRTIYINNQELNAQQKYMSNSVSTAKYNVATFLPKFLFEEFSKSANVFFLFISGIQVRDRKKCA
jgi:hypothetical protein